MTYMHHHLSLSPPQASKQGKKRKVELTGFGSVKTIEKSRNAFTVSLLRTCTVVIRRQYDTPVLFPLMSASLLVC